MRNLVTELEVIVFGGIEPLRGEKKRRRQERKQELERNVNDGELQIGELEFQFFYHIAMPILYTRLLFLLTCVMFEEMVYKIQRFEMNLMEKWRTKRK